MKQELIDNPLLRLYAWVTRNMEGVLVVYADKPEKDIEVGDWFCPDADNYFVILDRHLPKGVNPRWDDDEPTPVLITLEKDNRYDKDI